MDDPKAQLRLDRINGKGMEVATKLAELLAGKDVDLAKIGVSGPELSNKKEARLRDFLDQINASRRRLQLGDYGTCRSCGIVFPDGALDDMPWIERCGDCAASDRSMTRWPDKR